jgi:predicted transcriptional regulator
MRDFLDAFPYVTWDSIAIIMERAKHFEAKIPARGSRYTLLKRLDEKKIIEFKKVKNEKAYRRKIDTHTPLSQLVVLVCHNFAGDKIKVSQLNAILETTSSTISTVLSQLLRDKYVERLSEKGSYEISLSILDHPIFTGEKKPRKARTSQKQSEAPKEEIYHPIEVIPNDEIKTKPITSKPDDFTSVMQQMMHYKQKADRCDDLERVLERIADVLMAAGTIEKP